MSDSRSVSGDMGFLFPTANIGSGGAQSHPGQPEIVPIPVVAAAPVSSAHHSSNPQKQPKGSKPGSKLLIIGIILCVIALVALAAILFLVFARPFEKVDAPEPPPISEVESIFSEATIPAPKLEGFMYIKTDDLSDPEVADFKTGAVTEDGAAKGSFICDGQASATFQNSSVKAVIPLTVKMTHAAESTSWVPGGIEQGDPDVSPTGPADIEAMQANLPNILKAYNQDVATQFVDCEVRPEASLSTQGGTVVFNLSKVVNDEEKTCSVNTDVTWGNDGWDVKVTSVAGLEEPVPEEEAPAEPQPAPEQPAASSSETSSGENTGSTSSTPSTPPSSSSSDNQGGSSSGNSTELYPTMLLECWSGDLVRVPGTIQVQSNGSVLLRTDDVIHVIFDNKTYITTYFELTGSGSFQNGQHVLVDGAITANGTNPIAPLVINMGWY